jgi:arsenate reductase
VARVLFVCHQNAGRSQMSEALFQLAANGQHQSRSAGTRPAMQVHPTAVDAMREVGIDVSQRRPQQLTDEMAEWADVVVTMGCGDECPYIPGKQFLDWDLPDPAGKPLNEVRMIRDDIRRRVDDLASNLTPGFSSAPGDR